MFMQFHSGGYIVFQRWMTMTDFMLFDIQFALLALLCVFIVHIGLVAEVHSISVFVDMSHAQEQKLP